MNLTPSQIEADKKLCEAATPGPWRLDADQGYAHYILDASGFPVPFFCDRLYELTAAQANAALAVRARTALPEYIAALADKDARIAKLEARLASATKALGKIAKQDTAEEMGAEAAEDADWETAYGIMVGDAREALRSGTESK